MLACGMIKFVQHQFGVCVQLQRRAAEHDEIGCVPVCPAADAGEAVDIRQRIGCTLGIIVEMKYLMRRPAHAHAAGQLGHGVGGDGASLGELALRH